MNPLKCVKQYDGAGKKLSSVDPEITKQITSSLVTGLQFATDELNSGKNKSDGFL